MIFGLAPIIIVNLVNPNWIVYSGHSFLHLSNIYQTLNNPLSPENPILAGKPLYYPWMFHYVSGLISRQFNIFPNTAVVLINAFSILVTIAVVYKLAFRINSSKITASFAVLLPIFASGLPVKQFVGFVGRIPLTELDVFFPLREPTLTKFININTMSLGIVFYCLFLYALVNTFSSKSNKKVSYVLLFVSTAGMGFFYPLVLPAALLGFGLTVIGILLMKLPRAHARGIFSLRFVGSKIPPKRKTLRIHPRTHVRGFLRRGIKKSNISTLMLQIVAISLGLVIALPYLLQISGGESSVFSLTTNSKHLLLKVSKYLIATLPMFTIVHIARKKTVAVYKAKPILFMVFFASIISVSFLYITFSVGIVAEYKFRLLAILVLGILASVSFEDFYTKHKSVAILLIYLLLFSATSHVMYNSKPVHSSKMADSYLIDETHLKHEDKKQEGLYAWIRTKTANNAVFIDSYLTIPVFGERSLYVGLDKRQKKFGENNTPKYNGWYYSAESLLNQSGYPLELVHQRQENVSNIFAKSKNVPKEVVEQLQLFAQKRSLYVVAREEHVKQKLSKEDVWLKAFENDDVSVFKLVN